MKSEESLNRLTYWFWLANIKGIGPSIFNMLLDLFGSPEYIYECNRQEVEDRLKSAKEVRFPTKVSQMLEDSKKDLTTADSTAMRLLHKAASLNAQIITLQDDGYPLYLKSQKSIAPPILFSRGNLECAYEGAIAIVGTRMPSRYGIDMAESLGRKLASKGWVTVSGLARGIDSHAHYGTLDGGGYTIAVLGCGVDRVYPIENAELFEKILNHGLIISQFPFGTPPEPNNLRKRNQLIAALSRCLIVVEAPRDSGAMIAVRFGQEQGKPIFAVKPIDLSDERSERPIALIGLGKAFSIKDVSNFVDRLASFGCEKVQEQYRALPDYSGKLEELDSLTHEVKLVKRKWYTTIKNVTINSVDTTLKPMLECIDRVHELGYTKIRASIVHDAIKKEIGERDSSKNKTSKYSLHINQIGKDIIEGIVINQSRATDVLKGKEIKGILFDLDGVLIDTRKLVTQAYNYLLRKYLNLKLSRLELSNLVGKSPDGVIKDYFPQSIDSMKKEFEKYFDQRYMNLAKVCPGIPEVLEKISSYGLKIAVVTSQTSSRANKLLALLPDKARIDVVVPWRFGLRPKPSAEPLREAVKQLGLANNEVVFVGDTPDDIRSGNNAGIMVIVALWATIYSFDEILVENPFYFAFKPEQILRLLFGNRENKLI